MLLLFAIYTTQSISTHNDSHLSTTTFTCQNMSNTDEAEEWQFWKTSKLFPNGKPLCLVSEQNTWHTATC